ncbi:MAG: YceG family protein [Oscillospiraceae bacterium]|nr:YceG family protein [Oscillospiraceae bacterium]
MIVEVISASAEPQQLSEDICQNAHERLATRGGHFTEREMIPVYFLLLAGYNDDESYNNLLFPLRGDIKKTGKPFAFIDTPLGKPSYDDVEAYKHIDRNNTTAVISGICASVKIGGSSERTYIAQHALMDMLKALKNSTNDLFVKGIGIASKFNLIVNAIGAGDTDEIPLILYYGIPTQDDLLFLCFAHRCGFDVICISPDKSVINVFTGCEFAGKLQIEQMENSKAVMPFPTRQLKSRISTVAYTAERELDTVLYGGDTLFRDHQYAKLDSAVLRTTEHEVHQLWEQQAKYRSGFAVKDDRVTVPTIFAKICGVKNGDTKEYLEMIEGFVTYNSVFALKAPSYKKPDLNVSRLYSVYHNGTQLLIDKLKRSPLNKCSYLSDDLQDLIFEKMQAVISDGLLTLDSPAEVVDYVMYTGLNLDKTVLQLLQKYDFTKDIPKFIVADTIEDQFSKLECTQLLLLSYLGFDVLVFCPTGYRDMEAYISSDAYDTHSYNEFVYNLSIPQFRIPSAPKPKKQGGGVFKNLFKKGR